jgi:hypothetical protein
MRRGEAVIGIWKHVRRDIPYSRLNKEVSGRGLCNVGIMVFWQGCLGKASDGEASVDDIAC